MSRTEWLAFAVDLLHRIRALHRADAAGYCRECTREWPCKTYKMANMEQAA